MSIQNTYYSLDGAYPVLGQYLYDEPDRFSNRLRLEDNSTVTDPNTFTNEILESAGYIAVDKPPIITASQVLEWVSESLSWNIREKNAEEIDAEWEKVKTLRDDHLKVLDWRFDRYKCEVRQGLTTTDRIEVLDEYAQQLRNITEQQDVFNINWPILDENEVLNS